MLLAGCGLGGNSGVGRKCLLRRSYVASSPGRSVLDSPFFQRLQTPARVMVWPVSLLWTEGRWHCGILVLCFPQKKPESVLAVCAQCWGERNRATHPQPVHFPECAHIVSVLRTQQERRALKGNTRLSPLRKRGLQMGSEMARLGATDRSPGWGQHLCLGTFSSSLDTGLVFRLLSWSLGKHL